MQDSLASDLGARLRALRAARAWTLEQASLATGLARSTLSKIENGQMSPTYDALLKVAAGFGLDLSELFSARQLPLGVGRRSITRNGEGAPHRTATYSHRLLCTDLSSKAMTPLRSTIRARAFEDFADWDRHAGEEFVYVLEGQLRVYTEFYEPADLVPGDSWYIDSRMGHRLVSIGPQDAEVLWLTTTSRPEPA